jgi:glyceraldehyde 3-phosphate dehydrogenase
MSIKIGINGFGRIGRNVFRIGIENPEIEFVGINDLTDVDVMAHLLKYDSAYGPFKGEVSTSNGNLVVNGKEIKYMAERDPANLPWGELGVDVVLESTGIFRDRASIEKHLAGGAKKVLLSVPSKSPSDVDATVVMGVNDEAMTADAKIISNASCTTNCLAPMSKAINDAFGIEEGLMTTIHSYTNDQNIQDGPHKDLRRARAAAANLIPTATGAANAIGLVIPELSGKMNGIAVRTPTITGSIVDLVCTLKQDVSVEEVNAVVKAAAEGPMKGVLQYCTDPIVSTDIIGNPHSSIFDAKLTSKIGSKMFKLISWYDNEFGYSSRCVDLFKRMAAEG